VYGAPDFIVEVLSPSTKKKDLTIKLNKYTEAGVKEYWLVDPDAKRVMVYRFEEDVVLNIYGFDSKVPVGIFDGKCEINFAELYEQIAFLYE
jgi:Uma2 family endonuclease